MPETRKCAGCGKDRDRAGMVRVVDDRPTVNAPAGKRAVHLCPGCELPPRPVCRVCPALANCRAGFCHTHGERWRRWGKPPIEEWAAAFLENRLNTCRACARHYNGYFDQLDCSKECHDEQQRRRALAAFHAKTPEEKRAMSLAAQARRRAKRRASWVEKWCVICGASIGVVSPTRALCKRNFCRRSYNQQKQDLFRQQAALAELQRGAAELERRLTDGP